jgi:glycosyltransferase involved in cell wall biosynthesis
LALAQQACELAGVRLHVAADVQPDEMPVLMSAADCLLVTSSVEGSPNAVKEALMCNLPVVATPVGDVPERLAGVDPSWLCPAEPEALAQAVRECIAGSRRSNGRDLAAGLDEARVADRIVALYCDLASISAGQSES